jgi:DHA1 family bicyclomycin/chloramphenicol resistance-like MFS transporter
MKRSRKINFIVIMFVTNALMASDIFIPVMPVIAEEFGVSSDAIQLSIPAYYFGYALLSVLMGVISDHVGRRIVMIWSLLLFAFFTLGIMATYDLSTLLILRFLQGIGAASGTVIGIAVISDTTQGRGRTKALSNLFSAVLISPLIAPVIGGFLTDHFDWRATMLFLLSWSVITFLLVYFFLPETHKQKDSQPPTFRAIQYQMVEYKSFFKSPGFISVLIIHSFMILAIRCNLTTAPFVLADYMGVSITAVGFYPAFISLGTLCGMRLTSSLVHKWSDEKLLNLAYRLGLISAILFLISALFFDTNPFLATATAFFFFMTMGITSNVSIGIAMGYSETSSAGISGLMALSRTICSIIGGGLASWFSDSSFISTAWVMLIVILFIGAAKQQLFQTQGQTI